MTDLKPSESHRGEVLVAIVNSLADWRIVVEQGWYRIPVANAPRRWPPQWIAFYKTKVFGSDAFVVRHFAKVRQIVEATRRDLFPDEGPTARSGKRYFKVLLEPLEELPEPIPSLRLRRIVFIPTTMYKLETATEINDLFDESPLEDALWRELRHLQLSAERQYFVEYEGRFFSLDFAVFCREGNLDIETDGDYWHADVKQIPDDNERNNMLTAHGWGVLRFNGLQIRERMASYCVPKIVEAVNKLGGLSEDHAPAPTYKVTKKGIVRQPNLFED